jgi:heme-degrading monooxygenase HmoA
MAVFQISRLRVKPGRLQDLLEHQRDVHEINKRHGLVSRRILRASLAGEDVGMVMIVSEFKDLQGYVDWTNGREGDPDYREWRKTIPANDPDAAADLLSTILVHDITPEYE